LKTSNNAISTEFQHVAQNLAHNQRRQNSSSDASNVVLNAKTPQPATAPLSASPLLPVTNSSSLNLLNLILNNNDTDMVQPKIKVTVIFDPDPAPDDPYPTLLNKDDVSFTFLIKIRCTINLGI
jgi:hypothetical protein